MKKDFYFLALMSAALIGYQSSSWAQEDTEISSENLSDGPQILAAPEPQTESVQPDAAEQEKDTPPKNIVVSEDELLKPKAKSKENNKIKSSPINESELYVQEADKYKLNDVFKNLQLNDVIEQGLRKNYDQNLRNQRQELNVIEFSGVKNAFWMPELKITLTTDNQKLSTLKNSSRPPTEPNSKSPSGALGLSLGDYTVFNWGKDYALYLNKKSSFERSEKILEETKRELKLDLIDNYFSLVSSKSIEKIRQDQLRQASFVYRLSKEKITVGKTSKQDYYQARSEYLKAQNDYHEAKILADQADEQVAYLITDPIGTKYVINELLEYRRLKITLDDLLSLTLKNNPNLLSNRVAIDNAERSYDVALKENMPLPKFSVNLGAYNKNFGSGENSTRYETYSDSGNIELVASINASWSLTGADGFLNGNKLATSRISKELALKDLEKNIHLTQSFIRQTYKTALSLQNQLVILEARIPSLQKTFDTVLDNYLGGRAKFYDFSLALQDMINTKIFFEQTKLQHLKSKLLLAKVAGIEDFPGENFEQLAQRAKGK